MELPREELSYSEPAGFDLDEDNDEFDGFADEDDE